MNPQIFDFPEWQVEDTIGGRLARLAEQIPCQMAIKWPTAEFNFAELNARANQVAHAILNKKRQSATVAILVGAPELQIVCQLGILKAGKACVPIDPEFPEVRRSDILADSQADIVLTDNTLGVIARRDKNERICIINLESVEEGTPRENPDLEIHSEDLAYVLYTSGSTGTPKGVMQNHRNLLHVAMLYHQDLGVACGDRITSPTGLTYTGTIWALLSSLMNGAAFVCSNFDSPHTFAYTLKQEEITVAQLITTLLRQFQQEADETLSLPDLRVVYTGGERLTRADVAQFTNTFPTSCRLVYNFGSTEAGIITHHAVDLDSICGSPEPILDEDSAFHVGHPVRDTRVSVVDQTGKETENEGEIVVSSDFLSPGYWADPNLTNKHFDLDPHNSETRRFQTSDMGRVNFEGALVLSGRKDFQVKVRGYRINMEEVEAALRSLKGVSGAAAAVHSDDRGKSRIVGYVQLENGTSLSVNQLRDELLTRVPEYMVPSLFLILNKLPVARNGKLDRSALPEPGSSRPAIDKPYVAPRTDEERLVCKLFSEILQIDRVGIHDNFLDLGGDSIAAFRFLGRLKSTCNVKMVPRVLFTSPSMESLAKHLEDSSAERE